MPFLANTNTYGAWGESEVIVVDSFSRLYGIILWQVRMGTGRIRGFNDQPNLFYYPGICVRDIPRCVVASGAEGYPLVIPLLRMLAVAEEQGRVFWLPPLIPRLAQHRMAFNKLVTYCRQHVSITREPLIPERGSALHRYHASFLHNNHIPIF